MNYLNKLLLVVLVAFSAQAFSQENQQEPDLDISVLEQEATVCVENYDMEFLVVFAADPQNEANDYAKVESFLKNPVLTPLNENYTAEEKMLCEAMAKGIVIGGVSNELVDIMKAMVETIFN